MNDSFEWDPEKAEANLAKHGVTFGEAESVFDDPFLLTSWDGGHSPGEDRFTSIGLSQRHRLLVVVHTYRGERIRIISARRATRREAKSYGN